jgi:hypothetical protein
MRQLPVVEMRVDEGTLAIEGNDRSTTSRATAVGLAVASIVIADEIASSAYAAGDATLDVRESTRAHRSARTTCDGRLRSIRDIRVSTRMFTIDAIEKRRSDSGFLARSLARLADASMISNRHKRRFHWKPEQKCPDSIEGSAAGATQSSDTGDHSLRRTPRPHRRSGLG